jgi:hypothetical protein
VANFGPEPVKWNFTAGADLSALQWTFVKLSADNTVVAVAAATDIPVGVLQNKPASGATAEVLVTGIGKVLASAAISAGAVIGTTSTGRAVAVVAGTDTTKYALGQVLAASGANGDILTAAVNCIDPHRAA